MTDRSDHERERAADREKRLVANIRAAGGYVKPTVDLRPRTLEAARHCVERRRSIWRLASVGLVVATLLVSGAQQRRSTRSDAYSSASARVEAKAYARAAVGAVGPIWGLVAAMSECREDQAQLLSGRRPQRPRDE